MNHTRSKFLASTSAVSAILAAGCVGLNKEKSSYTSQIVQPQNQNTVFHWVDLALQQVRDQRELGPRAAYNYALPMAAGFLAANGISQEYDEPFGVGAGPPGADPEVAYGVAFAIAATEAFQQSFIFDRSKFIDRFPGNEATSLGVQWGRDVGRHVVRMRTHDGV